MTVGKMTLFVATTLAALAAVAGKASADNASIFQATLAEPNQKTGEISTEQMRRLLADGGVTVLDTRTRAEFDAGHIPGAQNLDVPPSDQSVAVDRLVAGNKAMQLVLYCNGPYCQASRRLADQLVAAGYSNVRRYQLGMPVWRALGGPTAIELGGILRVFGADRTAVFIDARSPDEFTRGSVPGAHNLSLEELAAGRLKKLPLPEDDFNRRVIVFGRDAAQGKKLAEVLSTRPWHNVAYFPGSFVALDAALKAK